MATHLTSPRARTALDLDVVLSGRAGAGAIRALVTGPMPQGLAGALSGILPPDRRPSHCRLLDTKYEPGGGLTAYYLLAFPGVAAGRHLMVTWSARPVDRPEQLGLTALEEEAARRGLSSPFARLAARSDDGRVRVVVAPVDPAFPQLVRLHDHEHATRLVAAVTGGNGTSYRPETISYRPGEHHSLRLTAMGARAPDLVAKIYRDDSGARAIRVAGLLRRLLEGRVPGAQPAHPVGHAAVERVALWEASPGRPLWHWLRPDTPPPARLLQTVGRAMRIVHDGYDDFLASAELPVVDVDTEITATLQAAVHIEFLHPAAGGRLRDVTTRVARLVHRLPRERPTIGLRDVTCDRLLVHGDDLRLPDVDRAALTDPALDVGAFLADLRWWSRMRATEAGPAATAFLDGYGRGASQRVARARALAALYDLALVARRVPVHDPRWARHVEASVRVAEEAVAAMDRP